MGSVADSLATIVIEEAEVEKGTTQSVSVVYCKGCGAPINADAPVCLRCNFENPIPIAADVQRLQGVGGWLLVFWFSFVALLPLRLIRYFMHSENEWSLVQYIVFCVQVIGFICGILVLTRSSRLFLWLKLYFSTSFSLGTFELSLVTYDHYFGHPDAHPQLLRYAVTRLIRCVVWLVYFTNSKRVRATFGRNL